MSQDSDAQVPRHPIAVVSARTGLSADVLRVWERRYGAVIPERTPGGQRLYSDADIERLRMLNAATNAGRSIGQIATLDTNEIARLLDEDIGPAEQSGQGGAPASSTATVHVENAFAAMLTLDGRQVEHELQRAMARLGIPPFLEIVVAPLLQRIGDGWHAGRVTIAQEHLASSIVQHVLGTALHTLVPPEGAPRVLVATLSGERHTLGALLAAVAGAVAGWDVVCLYGDMPAEEVARAAVAAGARLVAISVAYADGDHVAGELHLLRARLPEATRVIVGGGGAAALARRLEALRIQVACNLNVFQAELQRAQ